MPTTALLKSSTEIGALALASKHNSINNLEREESQNPKTDNCYEKGTATGFKQEKSLVISSTYSTPFSISPPKVKRLQLSLSKQVEGGTTNIPFSIHKVECTKPASTTTYKSVLQQRDMNANQIQATNLTSSQKSLVTMLTLPLVTKQQKPQNQYQSSTKHSIVKIHQNKLGIKFISKQTSSTPSLFKCTICNKTYGLRHNLQKHMSLKHPQQYLSHCNITCNEDQCNFTCRFLSQLRHHLQQLRGIIIDTENKTFETQEG